MKSITRKLLIFGIVSTMLTTGCVTNPTNKSDESSSEAIASSDFEKENATETTNLVRSDIEATKIFEPGHHVIYYGKAIWERNSIVYEQGWGNVGLNVPEAPEGYMFVGALTVGRSAGEANLVYLYVNEVPVEAHASYNSINGQVGYFEPGIPVDELKLRKNN